MQVIEVIRHPHDKAESKYNPDAGISKEDEERYQKLQCENEELQRLIVQVSFTVFHIQTFRIDFHSIPLFSSHLLLGLLARASAERR